MTQAVITKTLDKVSEQPEEYSLGFRRLTSLPQRVRDRINVTCVLQGDNNTNSYKDWLGSLTETEFVNWLKFA